MAFFVQGEKIILRKDGVWIADGVEITHEQTRDLFFRSIHRDIKAGQYYLEVGYERIFIMIEDTPYFVTALNRKDGAGTGLSPETGAITVCLTNGSEQPITSNALSYEQGSLYLRTLDGERAKFLSAAYYDLLRDLQEDKTHYFLVIDGKRVNLAAKA
jgi:hypothetical protein